MNDFFTFMPGLNVLPDVPNERPVPGHRDRTPQGYPDKTFSRVTPQIDTPLYVWRVPGNIT